MSAKNESSVTLEKRGNEHVNSEAFSDYQRAGADSCRDTLRVQPGEPCPVNIPGRLCPKFCRCAS